MRRLLPIVLAVAAAAATAACGGGSARPGASSTPGACRATAVISVGEAIPFTCGFERPDGSRMTLADLKGKPSVINFWASWCPNCIREMPALQRAHERLGDRVRFIGANLLGVSGETRQAAGQFIAKTGIEYEVIYDTGGLLYAHFSGRLFPPTTIWVDANGIVRHRLFGELDLEEIEQTVRRYLGVA